MLWYDCANSITLFVYRIISYEIGTNDIKVNTPFLGN